MMNRFLEIREEVVRVVRNRAILERPGAAGEVVYGLAGGESVLTRGINGPWTVSSAPELRRTTYIGMVGVENLSMELLEVAKYGTISVVPRTAQKLLILGENPGGGVKAEVQQEAIVDGLGAINVIGAKINVGGVTADSYKGWRVYDLGKTLKAAEAFREEMLRRVNRE